jgi:hypothetical protein
MPFDFLLAALATWRLAHLLTREDGPYGLLARLRARAGDGAVGRALQCLYCTSVWVAAPLALFVAPWQARAAVVWLALSGAACLLDRLTARGLDVVPLEALPDESSPPPGG